MSLQKCLKKNPHMLMCNYSTDVPVASELHPTNQKVNGKICLTGEKTFICLPINNL